MTQTWLPGAEHIPATVSGGTYVAGYPWRIVVHSTEGASVESAVAAFRSSGSWPQLTVDMARRRIVQHYPLEEPGRSLVHPSSCETNRAHCIQIEIVGFAATTIPNTPAAELAWLGASVIRPLLEFCGAPPVAPAAWPPYPSSYGLHAGQRMSVAEWDHFTGVCAHMHVPGNLHGDPGALFITAVLDAAVGTPTQPPPPEDDMPAPTKLTLVRVDGDPTVHLVGFAGAGIEPIAVDNFGALDTVLGQLGADAFVHVDAVQGADSSDSHGNTRKVWVVTPSDAALFGL